MSAWGGRKVARLARLVVAMYGAVCYIGGPYCQEHGRAIDLTLRWPHRGSLSVEHLVARSRGGTDDPALLRPAHLACNAWKGDGSAPRAAAGRRVASAGVGFPGPDPGATPLAPSFPSPSPGQRGRPTRTPPGTRARARTRGR